MELLFILLIGAAIGGLARVSVPHRDRIGVVLVPAVGAGVASLAWVILTWAGLAWDGGLIWWISVIASVVASGAVAFVLGRARVAHDNARFAQLAGSSAPSA